VAADLDADWRGVVLRLIDRDEDGEVIVRVDDDPGFTC
jgi:hypothetical protein